MTLEEKLARAFPFARGIEVIVPPDDEGNSVAELLLAVRNGESRVRVYRYPARAPLLPDGSRAHEPLLHWSAPDLRLSFGEGDRWAFLASWDGVASRDEVRELVTKRLSRHPLLGTEDAS